MSGQAVIITGASSGIGRACALRLSASGFEVFAGVRKDEDAEALKHDATGSLTTLKLDVTEHHQLETITKQLEEQLTEKGLYALINNAGTAVAGPLEFIPPEELRRQFEVNVPGQLAVTQALLPLLRKGRGRVIMMSSISGRVAPPFLGPYAASKFALEALSDSLRRELSPWELEVVLIEPGRITTPIWEKSVQAADRLSQKLPPQAWELYGHAMSQVRERALAGVTQGTPPEAVAEVVVKALTAARPKPRYLIGRDARRANLLAKLVPDSWLDRLLASQRG